MTDPDWSPGSARKHLNGYQAFGSVPKVFLGKSHEFAFCDAPFKGEYTVIFHFL